MQGEEFSVCSHGVGASGATICFEELIKLGAKVLIRAGTSGALSKDLHQGDLVVSTGAVREDGTSNLMIPLGYPAVPDPDLFQTLKTVAAEKHKATAGLSLSSDLFYPSVMPTTLELYAKAGVSLVEMENSAFFVVCLLRGVRAAAINTIDGAPLRWKDGDYDPSGGKTKEGVKKMCEIALESARREAAKFKQH
eukprot:Platyproteum_vivax@DN4486_c0_g1_i1.p1